MFFDYARYSENTLNDIVTPLQINLASAGIELTFDVRAFRLLEVDLGLRYSYKIEDPFGGQSNNFEFLLLRVGI